jgi:hypothetical protein
MQIEEIMRDWFGKSLSVSVDESVLSDWRLPLPKLQMLIAFYAPEMKQIYKALSDTIDIYGLAYVDSRNSGAIAGKLPSVDVHKLTRAVLLCERITQSMSEMTAELANNLM